jgi:putative peptidoglycan lipid II flippase
MIETTKYLTGRAAYLTKRGLRLIALEVTGLQRAVYVLALFALLSSVLGLLRDRLLAHIFGASTTLDLYYAAFRIPDFLFVGIGALVSVYILIPELARRTSDEAEKYIDTILAGFSLLSAFLCIAAAIFAPAILSFLFPKFVVEGLLPTLTMMTRIMLMQPVLFGFSNIFGAITQSRHRYMLYSLSPLLYNLGMIVGAVFFYPIVGITGLAWGVVLGAALHMGIQVPSIVGDGFLRRIPRLSDTRALFETVIVSVPRALALSMSEIAELGLIALAALLAPGSIAIFNFAYNLQAVPLSIIGGSFSVAAFPGLAAALAAGKRDEFIAHVATAARHVLFWSLPATALLIVLRAHLVRVILGSGAFNWTDTRLTAAAFALFGLSLAAQGLMLLLVRGYYAAGRTFVPFAISAAIAVCTVVLGAASVGVLHNSMFSDMAKELLRVGGVPGTGVLALAFVYSFVSILGTLALLIHFEHRFRGFLKQVLLSWGQSLLASIACGFGAYITLSIAGPITLSSTLLSVFTRGLAGGLIGIASGAIVYALLGSREFAETLAALRAKIRRGKLSPSMVAATEEHV